MQIVVTVRTRNEEHRIGQFCESYSWADHILVADGGSDDRTVEIAKKFPNVSVDYFEKKAWLNGMYWRNPDSQHANFLFKWAESLNPDWIIFDDCDCRPNKQLRENARGLLTVTGRNVVMAVRLYLWGKDQHFPKMAKPGKEGKWETSLWAWRGDLGLRTIHSPGYHFTFKVDGEPVKDFRLDTNALEVLPPYCLIHYSWDDPDRVEKKMTFYRESGQIPNITHPLMFAGELEDLPEWAYE